ncbi:MAG: hypothetical protein GY719_04055 [bacterium]|nr:hypothetical protein [bacterium]
MNYGRQRLAVGIGFAVLFLLALTPPATAEKVVIPVGTEVRVKLLDALSTDGDASGKPFRLAVEQSIRVGGRVVVPVGSSARGEISSLQPPSRLKRKAKMSLQLTRIEIEGELRYVESSETTWKARRDGTVVTSTTLGAYAGGAAGAAAGDIFSNDDEKVRKLAAIGAVAGAVFANKRKHIELEPGHPLAFLIVDPVRVTTPEAIVAEGQSETGSEEADSEEADSAETGPDEPDEEDAPGEMAPEEVSARDVRSWGPFRTGMGDLRFLLPRMFLSISEYQRQLVTTQVSQFPFWWALFFHGLLSLIVVVFVWVLTRGTQAAPRARVVRRPFWLTFNAVTLTGILILALVLSESDGVFNLRWFFGGLASFMINVIAQWMYQRYDWAPKHIGGRDAAPPAWQAPAPQPVPQQAPDAGAAPMPASGPAPASATPPQGPPPVPAAPPVVTNPVAMPLAAVPAEQPAPAQMDGPTIQLPRDGEELIN